MNAEMDIPKNQWRSTGGEDPIERAKGAKHIFFFSRSLKTREKCISFALSFVQFVYFLREVCLLFKFFSRFEGTRGEKTRIFRT